MNHVPDSNVSSDQSIDAQWTTHEPEYGAVTIDYSMTGSGTRCIQMSAATAATLRDQLNALLAAPTSIVVEGRRDRRTFTAPAGVKLSYPNESTLAIEILRTDAPETH